MRLRIMVLALMSTAVAAQAGSINVVTTGKDAPRSIEKISCPTCVRKPKKEVQSIVELAPGTQKIEIRDIGGVKKVFRTESWLGGSPVVFVSKALPDSAPVIADGQPSEAESIAAAPATTPDRPAASAEADMIDEKSTTAAVTADMGAKAKADPKPASFDPSRLELRLN